MDNLPKPNRATYSPKKHAGRKQAFHHKILSQLTLKHWNATENWERLVKKLDAIQMIQLHKDEVR